MKFLHCTLKSLLADHERTKMVECAAIAALITVAAIVAITALGPKDPDSFNNLVSLLP